MSPSKSSEATLFSKSKIQDGGVFVDVAVGIPQEEPYQYFVPKDQAGDILIGSCVRVPVRFQSRVGYVVNISKTSKVEESKPITEIIEKDEILNKTTLQLTKWMSEYYQCSWGQAIETAMPAPFKKGKIRMRSRKEKESSTSLEHATPRHTLTKDQKKAFDSVSNALDKKQFQEFLLHGITGSGKTEIYLQLIEKLLEENRSSIVLVPEISLTPQITQRFKARFGDQVAVVHSKVSAGKRLEEWHRCRDGEVKIVIGPRSALFSPVKSLGLIIIDEEHDDSYKQNETPRYEALRVARMRSEMENAVVLKASATPSLESFYDTKQNKTKLLSLPKRIENRPLPQVKIINMSQEKRGIYTRIFSVDLENAIRKALDEKQQIILLLNRRGFAPFVFCPSCGYVVSCSRCRVSVVYHREKKKLLCHTCQFAVHSSLDCPECNKGKIRMLGLGTEKVEAEARRLFPEARIARMDRDATTKKDSHELFLRAFRKKETDILLGTQMIAKGHDFPDVSVIGVISADTILHLPDFRSSERTFDLLTQVAGRTGRGDIGGEVFIQTFAPSHYAIQSSKEHDYLKFYEKELEFRKELEMPPFRNLIQVIFSGKEEKEVFKKALEFRKSIESASDNEDILVTGPAPCIISKSHNQYFWNIYLKVNDVLKVNIVLRTVSKDLRSKNVKITYDINPR